MHKMKFLLFGLFAFSVMTLAYAEVPIAKGWYIDAAAGMTNTNSSDGDDNNALGYNVNAGYKFIPFLGLEAGYTSYGTSSSSFTGNHAIDIAVKGIIPFPEIGAEIFAKLGGAKVYPNDSDNESGLYYSFGGSYYFTSHFSGILQWSQARGGKDAGPFDLLSIGFGYLI